MMILETWIAALIAIFISIFCAIGMLGWLATSIAKDKVYDELLESQKENAELKRYIAVQRTKSIIGVANDFYNERKKK